MVRLAASPVEVEHLEVQRGSITALIGPNGASKTTFFNCLTGFGDPDEGEVESFDGTSMSKAPAQVPQAGMVRTFQLTRGPPLKHPSSRNMKLAAPDQRGENFFRALVPGSGGARSVRSRSADAPPEALQDGPHAQRVRRHPVRRRKLLEMAQALMCNPKIIMLDEPMAGCEPGPHPVLEHIRRCGPTAPPCSSSSTTWTWCRASSDWVVGDGRGFDHQREPA